MNVIASDKVVELPDPAGCAPLRRSQSMRRTTTIDVIWPEGREAEAIFDGRGRDCYTESANVPPESAPPKEVATDRIKATLDSHRQIVALEAVPNRIDLTSLVGAKAGGYFRQVLVDAMPDENNRGTLLHQLLDDLSGASLVAPWAWSRWPSVLSNEDIQEKMDAARERMEGICTGFAKGSSALVRGAPIVHRSAVVEPLLNPQDELGWHSLAEAKGIAFRRARRIDVWKNSDGDFEVEAGFQDSATAPDDQRIAVHEYTLTARVDGQAMQLKAINARPHILPFPECPGAIKSISQLVGTPMQALRAQVLERFPKEKGCTHLNDAMRALADVPCLIEQLISRLK